jgi:excisionase family DNA binding protein
MKNETVDRFETIEEIANLLGVPKSFIYARTRTNSIPHYKIGKYCRFIRSEVLEWARGKRATGGQKEGV